MLSRTNAVVPVAMEVVTLDLDSSKVVIGHDQALGIVGTVEFRTHLQTATCLGAGNEVDDDLMTDQRASAPIHRNE